MNDHLSLDDVPTANAPWEEIAEFAQSFNGYAHFGNDWLRRMSAMRERFLATGELGDSIADLRAALFCEFRGDRFTWGEDVIFTEPDAHGIRHVRSNPEFETSPTQQYRRAIIAYIRDLLERQRRCRDGSRKR